jgi:signal transduction histidine kinase
VSNRRLQTLRKLSAPGAEGALTVVDACRGAVSALAENPYSIPFAAIYLLDEGGSNPRLAASGGFSESDDPLVLLEALSRGDPEAFGPVASVVRTGHPADVDLDKHDLRLPGGAWPEHARSAVVLPIPAAAHKSPAGLLVVGVSPRRPLDAAYRSFLELVAGHIGTTIGHATAYETYLELAQERDCRLAEVERALSFSDTFVGVLGHDLRNPLAAIMTTSDLLLRREQDARISGPIERIRSSADRMARMIEQILDFTRARIGGGIPIHTRTVDIQDLAHDLVEELEGAASRGIVIESTGDTCGEWDPDRLAQVISNLLANAIEHGASNEPIRLVIDGTKGDVVRIEVWNAGSIAEDVLPRLFHPFGAARAVRGAGKAKGLGLGLFIVHQIAEAHEGTIDVESSELEGTRFNISLPRKSAALGPLIWERTEGR